jgi:hypothetical protein
LPSDLSYKQLAFSVGYGFALWIGAAFLVRTIGPMGAFSGWGLAISFAAVIPAIVPAVLLTRSVVGEFRDQLVLSVAIITAIACLLDGLTLAFFPQVYGADAKSFAAIAGFLLWGGGVGLVLAIVMGRSR